LKSDADCTFKADNPALNGSGGKFKFQAANPSTVVLQFGYQRPWETDVRPAATFAVTINVKDTR